MSISFGSVLICIFVVIVLFLYIELILSIGTNLIISKSRLIFWGVSLLCIRAVIPFNFPFTVTIPIKRVLYRMNDVLMHPVIFHFKIYHIIWGIWILGFIIQLMKYLLSYKQHYNLIRQAAALNHEKKNLIRPLLKQYSSKKIEVAIISEPISPAICGIIHPILVMPDYDFSNEDLDLIIKHEMTHYVKHDMITKTVLDICTCFYWWNPIMYLLRNRFFLIIEIANDLSIITNKDYIYQYKYMQCLIKCSKYCSDKIKVKESNVVTTIPFIKNVTHLKIRISEMIQYKKRKLGVLYRVLNYIAILFIVTIGILVVPESYYIPSEIKENTISIEQNNSYLLKTDKGYELYINDKYVITFSKIDESLRSLPIYEE